jgi:hypothetical protein
MTKERHPSRRRLQQWLVGESPRRVDRHVEGCEHCEALLEELSALDVSTVADLHDAVTPPSDLANRTTDGVGERLRDEAALATFLDLFTVGWATARAIVDPEAQLRPTDADDITGEGT